MLGSIVTDCVEVEVEMSLSVEVEVTWTVIVSKSSTVLVVENVSVTAGSEIVTALVSTLVSKLVTGEGVIETVGVDLVTTSTISGRIAAVLVVVGTDPLTDEHCTWVAH